MIDLIGWMGALLLGICGIPEVIHTLQTSQVNLTWGLLLFWFFGEILALIYTYNKSKKVRLFPLIFNYGLNIICISILIWYKL